MKQINEIELACLLSHAAVVDELVDKNACYPTEECLWEFDKDSETDIYKEENPPQKEIEDIISNKGVGKKESDIYREHGIEILAEDEFTPAASEAGGSSNIIASKLFGNTTSKTTISDYSLPKISRDQENIHDPYHEAI